MHRTFFSGIEIMGFGLFFAAFAGAEVVPGLEVYGELELVDEIVCATDAAHAMRDFPSGASYVTNILGTACRALPHTKANAAGKESGALLSYRIGAGKGLAANAAYVLVAEYPEDAPRAMTVINNGNESRRGFHTGATAGDALTPKYVMNFCEILDIPLSGAWEQWSMLMFLNEKTKPYNSETATLLPADGFDVTFALMPQEDDILSQGAAVRAIRLYRVLDEAAIAARLCLPPEGLPQRHLFWREEMSDGAIADFADPLAWYDHKARLMRFLGMNTFSKDLLEFGANQHWDSTYKDYGGNNWVYMGDQAGLWGRIVELMGGYGYNVFPYYEYAGSRGYSGLGPQKRAWTLHHDEGKTAYTQTSWIEASLVDLTSEAAKEDFRKMLDCTVLRYKDKANFVGAWIRSRMQMPVSFHDDTIALFNAETGNSATRATLIANTTQYNAYLDWWFLKRREFFEAMRDFMRDNGVDDAKMLYSSTSAESGEYMSNWYGPLVADTGGSAKYRAAGYTDTISGQGSMSWYFYELGLLGTWPNWGNYEYQHAGPADDPQNYAAADGVALAYPFNRTFTVVNRDYLDAYRNAADLALVRHYTLNENMMFDTADARIAGYFTADFERAGRACMQSEVMAMAQGDPTMIGYLVGANFGRGFSVPAREFNQNFLALPALPSEIVHAEGNIILDAVTLRRITTDTRGSFFSLTHVGYTPKTARVTFPADIATVYEIVSGKKHTLDDAHTLTLDLQPFQLLAFSTEPPTSGTPPVLTVSADSATLDAARVSVNIIDLGSGAETAVVTFTCATTPEMDARVAESGTTIDAPQILAHTFTNLANDTQYYARVAVSNQIGTVAASPVVAFRTLAPVVFGDTQIEILDNGTRAQIIVTITELNIAALDLTVSLNGNAATVLRDITAPGTYTLTVEHLAPNKTYNACVVAESGLCHAPVFTDDFVTSYAVTNDWFTVDFEDYISGDAWTNTIDATGTWTLVTRSEDDRASVIALDNNAQALEFALQENSSVIYTCAEPSESGKTVLLDSRVKIATARNTLAFTSNVASAEKTAVMFVDDDHDDIAELHAWFTDAHGENSWVKMSNPRVAIADGAWIALRIELDGVTHDDAMVRFFVDDEAMTDATGNAWFVVANRATFSDGEAQTVRGIELLNFGTLDWFAGKRNAFPGITDVLFRFFAFVDNVLDDDLLAGTTRTENVPRGEPCEIVLSENYAVDGVTVALAKVVIFTNTTEFVECDFDATSEFFIDQNDGTQKFVYDTTGMEISSTPNPVRIYYVGTSVVGPTQKPVIGAGNGRNALQFVPGDDGDYFVVNITNPEADVFYTAFVAESLDETFIAAVSAQASSTDATLRLFITADSGTLFVQIVASASAFEIGAAMPK